MVRSIRMALGGTGLDDETVTLSAAQAARLGKDIDARNEHVASGELCVKCGAIRAGNRAENTPEAFVEFIRNSSFDRSTLLPWERETLSSYLGPDREGP